MTSPPMLFDDDFCGDLGVAFAPTETPPLKQPERNGGIDGLWSPMHFSPEEIDTLNRLTAMDAVASTAHAATAAVKSADVATTTSKKTFTAPLVINLRGASRASAENRRSRRLAKTKSEG